MKKMRMCVAAGTLLACAPAYGQPLPQLRGSPVVDLAEVIPPAQEAELVRQIAAVNAAAGHQVAVATVPSLQGADVVDYGNRLFRQWGLGSRAANDGVLILVAVAEKQSRIEVGYGLTPVLTDLESSLINRQKMVPRFKQGDFYGGVQQGVQAVGGVINAPQPARGTRVAGTPRQPSEEGHGVLWAGLLALLAVGGVAGGTYYAASVRRRRAWQAERARRRLELARLAPIARNKRATSRSSPSAPGGYRAQESEQKSTDREGWSAPVVMPMPYPTPPSDSGGSYHSSPVSGGFEGGGGSSGGSGSTASFDSGGGGGGDSGGGGGDGGGGGGGGE